MAHFLFDNHISSFQESYEQIDRRPLFPSGNLATSETMNQPTQGSLSLTATGLADRPKDSYISIRIYFSQPT